MPGVRFAVAGQPVAHSASPLLVELVRAHLRSQGHLLPWHEVTLLETDDVAQALAWSTATRGGGAAHEVPSSLTGARLTGWKGGRALTKVAQEVTATITEAPLDAVEHGYAALPRGLPAWPLEDGDETWLSLTSPLKSQLGASDQVVAVDGAGALQSVNQARRVRDMWWVANTDGPGVVAVARVHGLDPARGHVLVMRGGGGAARSTAAAWVAAGGLLVAVDGRRPLERDGPWTDGLVPANTVEALQRGLVIDFDTTPGRHAPREDLPTPRLAVRLHAAYGALTGDAADRWAACTMPAAGGLRLDGRWMLVAQHLEAWRILFAPALATLLPGLPLLLARLLATERTLQGASDAV